MSWKSIRLELACSPGFPRGSAGRAFLLRLPLRKDGSIDVGAIRLDGDRATVRRFWASEPDSAGNIVRHECGWLLYFSRADASTSFRMPDEKLIVGGSISIHGPDAMELPFRVISIEPLGRSAERSS